MMEDPTDKASERAQRCVALGVTGSIAAYKAADLASRLAQADIDIHVLLTQSAGRLIQSQTFLTLSRNPVITTLWDTPDWRPEHIALADIVELLVVAPATANFLGKLANGIADDALTTFALSHEGPVIVAPAMNPRMWRHPAVQANCQILRQRGVTFVGPEPGHVACSGIQGAPGRMSDVPVILNATLAALAAADLRDRAPRRVLVTAGPTREAIDPVRFLSNRSSGKMGYALAAVAAAAGHEVVLVSGPTTLPVPANVRRVNVTSAADMAAATAAEFPDCELLMMCGAVADYRPAAVAEQKIRKTEEPLELTLERTEDILATLAGTRKPGQIIVGFAAETRDITDSARDKLRRKGLDWIVANDVSRTDIGFGSDDNEATLVSADGRHIPLPKTTKLELAAAILRHVLTEQ